MEALKDIKDPKQHLDKELRMVQIGMAKWMGRDRYPLLQVI